MLRCWEAVFILELHSAETQDAIPTIVYKIFSHYLNKIYKNQNEGTLIDKKYSFVSTIRFTQRRIKIIKNGQQIRSFLCAERMMKTGG